MGVGLFFFFFSGPAFGMLLVPVLDLWTVDRRSEKASLHAPGVRR